jgi:hypothetical protein
MKLDASVHRDDDRVASGKDSAGLSVLSKHRILTTCESSRAYETKHEATYYSVGYMGPTHLMLYVKTYASR